MLASHTSEFVVVDRPPANPKVFCVGGGSEYFGDSLCRSKGPPFKQAVHTENRATAQSCLTSPKTDASLKNTHVWLIGKKPPLSRSPFPLPLCPHKHSLSDFHVERKQCAQLFLHRRRRGRRKGPLSFYKRSSKEKDQREGRGRERREGGEGRAG